MSENTQNWTPEPWNFWNENAGKQGHTFNIQDEAENLIALVDSEWWLPNGLHEANAARIVACVNALAGIPDPAAFVEQAKRLTAERDEAIRQRDAKDRILNIMQYADTTMTVGELLLHIAALTKEPRP